MTKGIMKTESDPRVVYADIIDLPHHQSEKHPHMSLYDRAAQFSSYKALSGYEDMVAEEIRLTDQKTTLSETQLDVLDQKLMLIGEVTKNGQHPVLNFIVFEPDSNKAGGKYLEIRDAVRRIDPVNRQVILMSTKEISGISKSIPFHRITDILGDLVDCLDDLY